MRNFTLTAACAAAFGVFAAGSAYAASPADYAVTTQGTLGVDYSYTSVDHASANTWGGSAAAIVPFGGAFSGQIDGAFHNVEPNGGGNYNDWNVGGAAAWSFGKGRLGVNAAYTGLGFDGLNLDAVNYGVYGEYYVDSRITAGLRGGGLTLNENAFGFHGSETGGYVGGEAVGYVIPDLMLQGQVEYAAISHISQTTVGVNAEYLVSRQIPVSVSAGYEYDNLGIYGENVDGNTVKVGVKFYFGGHGAPLVVRQRTGVDSWGAAPFDLRL